MSDSVRPHRRQPTRPCRPWDSPGKNTGVEWVAISFSNAWKWKVKVKLLSCVWLLATPWTAAYQAPPSMGFSRQEYWSGMPLPSPHMSSGNCKHMSIRMAKIQNTDNIKCWWAFGATGMLIHCWWEWMKKGTATLKDSLSVSYKTEHSYHTILQSSSLVFTQRRRKFMSKNLHMNIYSSFFITAKLGSK